MEMNMAAGSVSMNERFDDAHLRAGFCKVRAVCDRMTRCGAKRPGFGAKCFDTVLTRQPRSQARSQARHLRTVAPRCRLRAYVICIDGCRTVGAGQRSYVRNGLRVPDTCQDRGCITMRMCFPNALGALTAIGALLYSLP